MATSSTSQNASPSQPALGWQVVNAGYRIASQAAAGALCGWMFSINPIGAAVNAATSTLASTFLYAIGDNMENSGHKTAIKAIGFFGGIAAGLGAFVALGNPLTVGTAVTLILGTVLTTLAIEVLKGGAKCAGACAAGGVLALRDRFA